MGIESILLFVTLALWAAGFRLRGPPAALRGDPSAGLPANLQCHHPRPQ